MSVVHKGETWAKALRDRCNFLTKCTEGERGSFILNNKASVGNEGSQVKIRKSNLGGVLLSEFAAILFGFFLFLFLPQMVKCLILKPHSETKVLKEG